MRRKEILLDFTPLLDVTLILLFFFILFSHMEVLEEKAAADTATAAAAAAAAAAEEKAAAAQALSVQFEEELQLIRNADMRKAADFEAMLAFSRSSNIKLILNMQENGWTLYVCQSGESLAEVPSGTDISTGIRNGLSAAGLTADSTILCEFILDGSEPGTASAYRPIKKALAAIQQTHKYFYCSETDISIAED